jgi:tetratricopeptide (TPR) repeat protein
MKIREVSMNKSLILTLSFAICVGVAARANADKVYMKVGGQPMTVRSIVWVGSENVYSVETATGVKMPIEKSKVDHVEVPKPPAWDKAVQAFNGGDLAGAITAFEGIVTSYQMLGWDNKARDYLGAAYSKKKDFKKAAEVYKKLFATASPSEITSATQKRYWEALSANNDYTALQKEIDNDIATGSRENAAAAHVARGDMFKKQGKNFEALMDYLKTVILFQKVDEVQPEALYKTAQCLEEMRDQRADSFKKKLVDDYPGSEWAAKLK